MPQMLQTVLENIDAVVRLEGKAIRDRTWSERVGNAIGGFAGTMLFVFLHLLWFAVWVGVNSGWIPSVPQFDPYPYQLLALLVSLEGVLLTTFVLIMQNRMGLMSDRRNQLDLQINLLTEKEVTKLIQMLQQISAKLEIEADVADDETRELGNETAVAKLAKALIERLPEDT